MEEDSYRAPRDYTLKLKDGIALDEIMDGKGAEFEVAEEFEDDGDDDLGGDDGFRREDVFKNLSFVCNDDGSDDENDDTTPFLRLEKKMEKLTGDGGVLKMLLQAGTGNVVPSDSVVRVHYNAYLEFSDEPFDSTRLRNRMERFRLGQVKVGEGYTGEAIPGVSVAVASMKKGELSRFLIKADYGFGESGCPPRIPPNATLMYEIELINFVEHAGVEEFFHLTNDEKKAIAWQNVKAVCDGGRKEGNILFQEKSYHKAQIKYRKAIDILEGYHLKDEEEEKQQQKLLLKLYLNISLCYLRLARFPPTITFSKKALEIERNNVKALYRIGQALHRLGDFDKSKEYLIRAQKMEPKNAEINSELGKLARSVENFHICETQMYQRMFSQSSSQPGDEPSETKKTKQNTASLDDFKNVVRKKLIEMKENQDMDDMPFPNGSLTPTEICCILETAEELDLDVIKRGQEPNVQVLVRKKQVLKP